MVLSKLKKTFVFPPLETVVVQSYDSKSWESAYNGSKAITVRIGRKVRFPCTWDRIIPLPTWEDLYVGLLVWCVLLHYQRSMWVKRAYGEPKKYRRTDCQELTTRFLKHWRVDAAYKLIMEKANAD